MSFNQPRNGEPISLSGSFSDASADQATDAILVKGALSGAFHLYWSGLDAYNATVILQGSNVNNSADEYWNDLGGDSGGAIMLRDPDSQIWEFTKFTTKYIRLSYQANNVTTGTINWYFEAY